MAALRVVAAAVLCRLSLTTRDLRPRLATGSSRTGVFVNGLVRHGGFAGRVAGRLFSILRRFMSPVLTLGEGESDVHLPALAMDTSDGPADGCAVSTSAAVAEQLSGLEYGLARTTDDRLGAFQLIHQAYVRAGLGKPLPLNLRVTRHQLQPRSQVFVGVLAGEVVSTVSLIGDGPLGLPMESMFGPEVAQLRAEGESLSEVSCLADRRQDVRRFLPTFRELTRLMAQFARYQSIDSLLITVNPRHVKFYTHYLGFVPISRRITDCPHVENHPAVALRLEFARIDRDRPVCWDAYFGNWIPRGELAPYAIGRYELELLDAVVSA